MTKLAHVFRVLSLLALSMAAQAQAEVEMADTMRSEGKIYVVVAIIGIILIGLFLYLAQMDSKLNRLEKKLNEKKQRTN